jgi:hypothetical protein
VRTPLLGELPRQLLEDFAGSLARVCDTLSLGKFEDQDHAQVALAGDDAGRIWPVRVTQRPLMRAAVRSRSGSSHSIRNSMATRVATVSGFISLMAPG